MPTNQPTNQPTNRNLNHQNQVRNDFKDANFEVGAGCNRSPSCPVAVQHCVEHGPCRPPPSLTRSRKCNTIQPPTHRQAGLSHYTRVKGRPLPNTAALLAKWRPEALVLNWGLGTLTHFGPDCVNQPGKDAACSSTNTTDGGR